MEIQTLVLTLAGFITGGFICWLVEYKPYLLSDSVNDESNCDGSHSGARLFIFMLVLGAIFWVLGNAGFYMGHLSRYAILLTIISGAALFDMNHRLIPNRLIVVGIFGWIIIALFGYVSITESVIAGTCASLLMLLIRWLGFVFFQKAGMGMGDIKLVFLIGLFLQWEVFWVLYVALFAGGVFAGIALGLHLLKRKHRLAFAPFLAIGVLLSALLMPFNKFLELWI